MFRWFTRLCLTFILIASLITNVLSITSTAFNAALSGLVATVFGVRTVTGVRQSKLSNHKIHVRNLGRSTARGTKRLAAFNLAEIPASAFPVAGLAVLTLGTAWELKQLCDQLREMEELYAEMEITEHADGAALRTVCHPRLWRSKEEAVP